MPSKDICEDCIKKNTDKCKHITIGDFSELCINHATSTGHWIIVDDCEKFIAKCSECGKAVDSRMLKVKCPECRAEMENA